MYVSGPLYAPASYLRGESEGEYPAVPPRLYPHDCYPAIPSAQPGDAKPRPSFYISDILYPSVIPLPGTLPTTGGSVHAGQRAGETSPLSTASSPPSLPRETSSRGSPDRSPEQRGCVRVIQPLPIRLPPVKSKDLKFGIDTILGSGHSCKSDKSGKEDRFISRIDADIEKRGFMPVPHPVVRAREHAPGHGLPVHGGPHLSVPSDVPSCAILYSPMPTYPHHHPGVPGVSPGAPGLPRMVPTSTGLPSNLPGRYGARPSDYPGVSSPGLPPPDHGAHLAPGPGRHDAPHPGHSNKRARPLSLALCWPTVRYHHGPYSVLGTGTDGAAPQSQPKRKRSWSRAVFSNLQRKGLEKRFEVQKYVTKPDRRQVAAMLGLTDAQVKVWFQNRRMKWRHQEEAKRKKEEEERKRKETDKEEKEKEQQQQQSAPVTGKGDGEDSGAEPNHSTDVDVERGCSDTGSARLGGGSVALCDMEEGEYSSDEERELRIDTQEEYTTDGEDDDGSGVPELPVVMATDKN